MVFCVRYDAHGSHFNPSIPAQSAAGSQQHCVSAKLEGKLGAGAALAKNLGLVLLPFLLLLLAPTHPTTTFKVCWRQRSPHNQNVVQQSPQLRSASITLRPDV